MLLVTPELLIVAEAKVTSVFGMLMRSVLGPALNVRESPVVVLIWRLPPIDLPVKEVNAPVFVT